MQYDYFSDLFRLHDRCSCIKFGVCSIQYIYMYLHIASTGIFDLKKTKINVEARTNRFETETVFNYLSLNR
jgi:hypothetical protein